MSNLTTTELLNFVQANFNQLFNELARDKEFNVCKSREDVLTRMMIYAEQIHFDGDVGYYKHV